MVEFEVTGEYGRMHLTEFACAKMVAGLKFGKFLESFISM